MGNREPAFPDYEVLVRGAGSEELLVVGIFLNDHKEADFLIGVASEDVLSTVLLVLHSTLKALAGGVRWLDGHSVADENERRKSEGGELPLG